MDLCQDETKTAASQRSEEAKKRLMESLHVLLFPFPLQGHVPQMLKLAELLSHAANLNITFLNTKSNHERFARNSPALDQLSQSPRFRFRTVPDGLKGEDPRPNVQILNLQESLNTICREPYREFLVPESGRDVDEWPPVSCVVADGIFTLAVQLPEEMGIPVIVLRTSSACSLWAYYSTHDLIRRGELPFPEGPDMDERIQGVAGMDGLLRRRDLPSLLQNFRSLTDQRLKFITAMSNNLKQAKALILNTFESLEAPVLPYIRSLCPVTFTIGPLQLLLKNKNLSTDFPSLWQQDRSCITWLDSQPNKSVVYISFGSTTVISRDELLEFWHGLVNSGQRFLWVTRPDLVQGITEATDEMKPPQLEEGIRERGCLVPWAPQEDVLAHSAVGCFLTHSGWNSTLESIVAGVPMICWPFFADQKINSRFVSEVWKIGVDMKDTCDRCTVERMIRKVMMDEELRTTIGEMAKIARESAEEGGSSHENFQKLIQYIKSVSIKQSRV